MSNDEHETGNRLDRMFFGNAHAALLGELKTKTGTEAQREALRGVVRIKDNAFLDRLIVLGIRPETALALRLIPLVFVAWADGEVHERERQAVLRAAREQGLAAERRSQEMLVEWLSHPPDPRLLDLWKDYIKRMWDRFTDDEQWQMRNNLLGSAREVAEAAGGFLGLTSGISAAERRLLEELESVVR